MGLMKFSGDGVKQIKEIFNNAIKDKKILGKEPENAYMTDLLQALITSGKKVTAVPVFGEWIEVDTVDDLHLPITKTRIRAIEF